ncbi:glutaminyl-peptide cyclotransferase-like protein [Ambystoma mexicanum]|uniref:glutaminyl-peptide cyclotransferase-like protein n=1 Tax=Ambystoma mexicanum TaxID=8296 RepID=UPI0037E85F45
MSPSRRRRPSLGSQLPAGTAGPRPRSSLRGLGLSLGFLLAAALLLRVYLSVESGPAPGAAPGVKEARHKPRKLTGPQVKQLVSQVDLTRLWTANLQPMLIERYPGTPGSRLVQKLIQDRLSALSAGWNVQLNSFESDTPHGRLHFTNIIATLDPVARRRLVIACHRDSKYFPRDQLGRAFVGACDSAVPCSIMLEMVTAMDQELLRLKEKNADVTLQLLFLDGEEAFEQWTDTDSLYGARHLADHMAQTEHIHGGSEIEAINLFILLDLLGASNPLFTSHFQNTFSWFDRFVTIEKRLRKMALLQFLPTEPQYFRRDRVSGPVDDDHVPFLLKGVPVLHIIATPFPWVWHTMEDTEENLHKPTVENLCRILTVFVAEYLQI